MVSKKVVFLAVLAVLGLVILGCGKKGDPSPPEYFAPASVSNLTGSASPQGVHLSWDAPVATVRGERLVDLASFEIRRGEVAKGESTRFSELATLPIVIDPQSGAPTLSYTYNDATAVAGKTYEYRIFSFNEEGVTTGVGASVRVVVSGSGPLTLTK